MCRKESLNEGDKQLLEKLIACGQKQVLEDLNTVESDDLE